MSPANFESGVFGQNTPAWHGKGAVVAGTFDLNEAIMLGGLDWDVEKSPAYVFTPRGFEVIEDVFSVVRTTDYKPLGKTVGREYKPINNRLAFSCLETVLADKEVRWEAAISINGGARIAGVCSLSDTGVEIVKGDHHFAYVNVVTSHDGSMTLRIFPSDRRMVCENTVQAALRERDRKYTVNVRHSGDVVQKVEDARDIIAQCRSDYYAFCEWQKQLADTHVTRDGVEALLEELFPSAQPDENGKTSERSKTMRANKVTAYLAAVKRETLLLPQFAESSGASAYLLFNAATNYIDHDVAAKKDDQAAYALVGGGQDFKQKAMRSVASLFNVPLPSAK